MNGNRNNKTGQHHGCAYTGQKSYNNIFSSATSTQPRRGKHSTTSGSTMTPSKNTSTGTTQTFLTLLTKWNGKEGKPYGNKPLTSMPQPKRAGYSSNPSPTSTGFQYSSTNNTLTPQPAQRSPNSTKPTNSKSSTNSPSPRPRTLSPPQKRQTKQP